MANFKASLRNKVVHDEVFDGSGLDDMDSGGIYTDEDTSTFEIIIDATGTPDTFKWRKDNAAYTTGVAIIGGAITLSDGVTVTFLATTGHTVNDSWEIVAEDLGVNAIQNDLGDTLTIKDYSNYSLNDDTGHVNDDFKDYRRIYVRYYDSTSLTTLTQDGDTNPHWDTSNVVAFSSSFDFAIDRDTVLGIRLVTLPTWNSNDAYANLECVFYNSRFYQANDTVTGAEPAPDVNSKWDVVTEANLPEKYRTVEEFVAPVYNIMLCNDEKVHERHCEIKYLCADDFCRDQKAITIWKIMLLLRSIEIGMELREYDKVDQIIKDTIQICDECTC